MNDDERPSLESIDCVQETALSLDDLFDRFRDLPPIKRAEIIIGRYLELKCPGEEITAAFERWLCLNARTALQTNALEAHFMSLLEKE